MKFISMALEIFGFMWMLLLILFAIFGGRILIQFKNPTTKKLERITDITLHLETKKIPAD
jgi:hypothetical protein